ncbi:uncharacterized protein [Salminus brasiliensis]|uniref:uncharacterized protein n=1 Tax=Salminus brasiliensis TaxID=930266 RepID=UPI003B8348B9
MSEREGSSSAEPEGSVEEADDVQPEAPLCSVDSSPGEEQSEESGEDRQQQSNTAVVDDDEEEEEEEEEEKEEEKGEETEDPAWNGPSTSSGLHSSQTGPTEDLINQLSEEILRQRNKRTRGTITDSPPSMGMYIHGSGDANPVLRESRFWGLLENFIPVDEAHPPYIITIHPSQSSSEEDDHSSSAWGSEVSTVTNSNSLRDRAAPSTDEEEAEIFSAQQSGEDEAVMSESEDDNSRVEAVGEEDGCSSCSPVCAAVERAIKVHVVAPIVKACRSLRRRMRKTFRMGSEVHDSSSSSAAPLGSSESEVVAPDILLHHGSVVEAEAVEAPSTVRQGTRRLRFPKLKVSESSVVIMMTQILP